jgi:hypothetical protein
MTVKQRCKTTMAMRDNVSRKVRTSSLPTIPEGRTVQPRSKTNYHFLDSECVYNSSNDKRFQGGGKFLNASFGNPPVSRQSFKSGLSAFVNQLSSDGANAFSNTLEGVSPFQDHPHQNPPEDETVRDDDLILF